MIIYSWGDGTSYKWTSMVKTWLVHVLYGIETQSSLCDSFREYWNGPWNGSPRSLHQPGVHRPPGHRLVGWGHKQINCFLFRMQIAILSLRAAAGPKGVLGGYLFNKHQKHRVALQGRWVCIRSISGALITIARRRNFVLIDSRHNISEFFSGFWMDFLNPILDSWMSTVETISCES